MPLVPLYIYGCIMQVELKHIYKAFGPVQANKDISLSIPAGCIHGILGENGAGKSTLIKVLSGFINADTGEILLNGQPVSIHSPAEAIHHGIGMLHQDPLDFPTMRVIDNLIMGYRGGWFPSSKAIADAFLELQRQFNFSLDPYAYVDMLTVGERQQLELLRLLWLGAQVLILDEPTTGISALQKQKLFSALRQLAADGKTIIFVTHKLDEVHELCDRVAVLRAGELVAELRPPYHSDDFVQHMFGRMIELPPPQNTTTPQVTLHIKGGVVEDSRLRVGEVNLDVRAGEVIGLAGMEGSGQSLFLRMCAGLLRPVAGEMHLHDRNMIGQPYTTFLHNHVKYLPADRLADGLIAGLNLTEHCALTGNEQRFFVDYRHAEKQAQERIAAYNIRGTPDSPVQALSGGNQQRTLLALLNSPISLLLLEQPTRGLDMESAIWIWGKLKERARQEGTAIIFTASDLDEVLHYSDRILVFFAGQVSAPLDAATISVEQLGRLIGGVGDETSQAQAATHA